MNQEKVIKELVGSMYDKKNPLRLLSINSFCNLLSFASVPCECDVCDDNEEESHQKLIYDVTFVVEGEQIKSVKSKTSMHSEVFRAMFEGIFCESRNKFVTITDASFEAFKLFNQSLLSGRFNPLLFEVENEETLVEVLQLANRYLVKRLEERIVNVICSNMPVYFDVVLKSNSFLVSRPLLARTILYVCQEITSDKKYDFVLYILKYICKEDFINIVGKIIKRCCIHKF